MELFRNKLILAPMAGITETVFRTICRRQGADVVVSEMVSADGLFYGGEKTRALMAFTDEERPVGIQLFGANPAHCAYAAQYVEEHAKPDFIDCNCGCPVPKVVGKNGGAALLKDPALFEAVLTALIKAVSIPVTVKLRSGWTKGDWVDTEFAKRAEACGVAAITLHPRSRTMGFSGSALWERIARVKESVRVPVIGNGDITAPRDAAEMRSQTGCDSVMIGRGTYGNPWLFRQILQLFRGEEPSAVSAAERTDTALWHLREYRRVYGEARTAREMKKHLAAYTRGIENGAALRNRLFRAESTAELEFAIAEAFAR